MIPILLLSNAALFLILIVLQIKNSAHSKTGLYDMLEKGQERQDKLIRDEMARMKAYTETQLKSNREELSNGLSALSLSLIKQLTDVSAHQASYVEKLKDGVEKKLTLIQNDNNTKLESMRQTVDEKLHATLEKRLGDSFQLVSNRLEEVHKGLGEMQGLALGVGDLKRVLTNVKTRGVWGEVQLQMLLDQILTSDQYAKNVKTKKNASEYVEFALKLPGKDSAKTDPMWLPIDSKFPQDAYENLLKAEESGSKELIEQMGKQLETRLKGAAKDIFTKYVNPPDTTDFAILFVPVEGLYAEILRRPGLQEFCQTEYRVLVAGPTNIAALLNCLQMGFRTLAIEKRTSEVWSLLSTVKGEFGKFGDLLEKTHDKLQTASRSLEDATRKSRTIERKLGHVQGIGEPETSTTVLIE